jgi:2-polyprenyl-3-methyl-5-hydroxy-6-metoxy-1,4-benzoquinol methylase
LKCRVCSLVFVHPQPDATSLAGHYDRSYYSDWLDRQRQKRIRMWRKRLSTIGKVASRGKLLDVGCGEGLFLELAKKAGWQIYGTEISQFARDFASQSLGIDIFCGDIWDAGFDSDSFDVVTMWHVLEHACDPLKVLGEIYRIIRPDGYLIVAVPNVNDIVMQTAYRFIRGARPELFSLDSREVHLFHFSADTIEAILKHSGFKAFRIGPDFGITELPKKLINYLATATYCLTGIHLYNAIEVVSGPLK